MQVIPCEFLLSLVEDQPPKSGTRFGFGSTNSSADPSLVHDRSSSSNGHPAYSWLYGFLWGNRMSMWLYFAQHSVWGLDKLLYKPFLFLFLLIILIIISFISHLVNYFFLKVKEGKNMDVSENSGTPKSSILIGFSIINHPNGRIAFQTTMAPGPPVCVVWCGGHHRCWVPQMEGRVTKVVVSPVFAPGWVKDFRWFHMIS